MMRHERLAVVLANMAVRGEAGFRAQVAGELAAVIVLHDDHLLAAREDAHHFLGVKRNNPLDGQLVGHNAFLAGEEGIVANQLAIKWIVPVHAEEVMRILSRSKKVIIVENNYSGQFARYLRSETGFSAHGHIRKYDGEPFMPHHIVEAVKEQLAGKTTLSVPVHELIV